MTGRVVLLNGTSSSGKSTLAAALRPLLPASFHYYASDQLADAGFRPINPDARWRERDRFFDGYHRSIAAFAHAGIDLLVEHVIERASWGRQLDALLRPFDVYRVGVHAPVEMLEERERQRGDRQAGEALSYLTTHDWCMYDLEVLNVGPPGDTARDIVSSWSARHAGRQG